MIKSTIYIKLNCKTGKFTEFNTITIVIMPEDGIPDVLRLAIADDKPTNSIDVKGNVTPNVCAINITAMAS